MKLSLYTGPKDEVMKASMFGYRDKGSRFACFRWLEVVFTPSIRTKAKTADGRVFLYIDDRSLGEQAPDKRSKYHVNALILDNENVLEVALNLPKIDEKDISSAVSLSVQSISPFLIENTAYAWRIDGSQLNQSSVSVVIAAKSTISELLSRFERSEEYEIWYANNEGDVYRFNGYGEERRKSIYNRYIGFGLLLSFGILIASTIWMITPTAQLRFRAIEAFNQYQAMVEATKTQVQKKNELIVAADIINNIRELLINKADLQKLLVLLTENLPDDTHVLNLEVQDLKVKISGITGNSNNLMKMLGDRPEVKNLRAPAPVTRQPGSSQEGFTLEFNLAPGLMSKLPENIAAAENAEQSGNAK